MSAKFEGRQPGTRFGRLVVQRDTGKRNADLRRLYRCVCDCGKSITTDLRNTRSCGCLQKERAAQANMKHKRLEPGEANFKRLFGTYAHSAIKRGFAFAITRDDFKRLTSSPCHYCGAAPAQVCNYNPQSFGPYFYNGLDRVENDKGYLLDNVVPCCYQCNVAKHNRTQKEFLEWLKRIYTHQYFHNAGFRST